MRPSLRSGGAARLTWLAAGVADQVSLSLLNFGIMAAYARSSSPENFGAFALLFVIVSVGVNGYRSILGVRVLTSQATDVRIERRSTATVAALWGLATASIVAMLGAWTTPLPIGAVAAASLMAALLPVLDGERLLAYSHGQRLRPFALSGVTLLLSGAIYIWLLRERGPGTAGAELVLPMTGGLIVVTAPLLWQITFSRQALREYFARHWAQLKPLTSTFALASAGQTLVPYAVAATAGLGVSAGFRGAQSFVGLPLQVPQGLLPMFTKRAHLEYTAGRLRRLPLLWSWCAVQALLLGAFLVAALLAPDGFGRPLLGETWAVAEPALPWMLLSAFFAQVVTGVEAILRAEHRAEAMVIVRAGMLVPTIGGAAVGALAWGPSGAAVGLGAANGITAIWASWRLVRAQPSRSTVKELL